MLPRWPISSRRARSWALEAVVDGGVVDGHRSAGSRWRAGSPGDRRWAGGCRRRRRGDRRGRRRCARRGRRLRGRRSRTPRRRPGCACGGHRVQHLVELERGAELEPRIDELAQLVVALLEAFEQPRLAERPGQELAHRRQEVAVPREVAGLVVVDVDQPVDDAVDDERQREVALEPPLGKDAALLGVDARVVGRSDDDDLLRLDRLPGAGKSSTRSECPTESSS